MIFFYLLKTNIFWFIRAIFEIACDILKQQRFLSKLYTNYEIVKPYTHK